MKIIAQNNPQSIDLACKFLRSGKAISFATDTVYGIGVDACNEKAVELLYLLKKRDPKKPIAIFVKDIATAKDIFDFDETAEKISKKFLPGSLTLVLKQKSQTKIKIAKNLNLDAENFLGFRIVDCDFVKKLIAAFDGVLAVTSANPSGLEPASKATEVEKYFVNSDLDLIIDGGNLTPKNISTVVKVAGKKIEILRHGAILESLITNI
ncbi:MAG: threonylcarbamoyl-AMP synthase [Proteobacteria bacterium]|nr:threonylcarbamoyl-AMP synthase [Pseudomonadota bacterium]